MEVYIFLSLLVLVIVFCVFGNINKKHIFNSLELGDKISYMPGINGATLFGNKKETFIIAIEKDDDDNIEYIYTEDGGRYDFLDYKKEKFTISTNTLFD